MNLFIQIKVLQTLEKDQTQKDLLHIIKKRFEETHDTVGSWQGDEENPVLLLTYPSKEAFQAAYSWGMGIVDKILQLEQEGHDVKLKHVNSSESSEEISEENESEIYLTLHYMTNWKAPMRNNYLINRKMAHLLGTQFYVEEIEDGFLIMYKRRVDFELAQLNRMDLNNVKKWLKENKIDTNNPSVQALLEYLRDYSQE
jgi:hypothetical protein